jgi:peptidoglycan/LPS O-acetylase OafA/YrhL
MTAPPGRSGAMDEHGFRLDIQGVRGFALVLVLACHAELPFAEGGYVGLDVFYVLSGFLITGLMLKEIDRTGSLSLLRFYARRARRLLPLAVSVLVVTAIGAFALFGPVRAYHVAGDIVAAALYFVNWRFIAESVEYFRFDDGVVSPVQHYWSLSVEEQFYILWPLVILGALAVGRAAGLNARRLLWLIVVPVGVGSFVYGLWYSGVAPERAYFSSVTRVWEIAVGCALALALPAGLRLPRSVSGVVTAAALVVLTWTAVTFTEELPYPGWHALLPTLATAAIIVVGTATAASAPIRLLSLPPLQYLGRISYAWYLWHWPVLVFAATLWGPLTPLQNVAVTLAAWFPTIASHYLIEERFRHSRALARRPRHAMALGASLTAAAVVIGLGLASLQPTVTVAEGSEVQGARAAERGEPLQRAARAIRPDPRHAEDDRGRAFDDRCHLKGTYKVESPRCVYGRARSSTSVVNLGDSHALMYFPALHRLARQRDWRLVNLTRAGCPVAAVRYERRCDAWRENSLRRIERERPNLVVVHNSIDERYRVTERGERRDRAASEPRLEAGLVRTLRRLRRTGAKVVVVRDMAPAPSDVVDCVADNLDDLERCAFRPRRPGARSFDARAARRVRGARLVDPMPVLCPRRRCAAVIGNVLVYRNHNHLTATFADTLAGWLGRRLGRV